MFGPTSLAKLRALQINLSPSDCRLAALSTKGVVHTGRLITHLGLTRLPLTRVGCPRYSERLLAYNLHRCACYPASRFDAREKSHGSRLNGRRVAEKPICPRSIEIKILPAPRGAIGHIDLFRVEKCPRHASKATRPSRS